MPPLTFHPFEESLVPALQAFREEGLSLREHRAFLDQLRNRLLWSWLAVDEAGRVRAYSLVRSWQNRPEVMSVNVRVDSREATDARLAATLGLTEAALAADPGELPPLAEAESVIAIPIPGALLPGMAAAGWEAFQELVHYRKPDLDVPEGVRPALDRAAAARAAAGQPEPVMRPFSEADLPALLEVEHSAFDPLWWIDEGGFRSSVGYAQGNFFVLTMGGRVVGYNINSWNPPQGYIGRLGVRRELQGRGLGRLMLAHALGPLRDAGAAYVELTTQVDNQTSRGLYESFGFGVVSSDWLLRRTLVR